MNRNGSRILLVLVGLPVIFAWGCSFFFSACANVTCDEGEVCDNGACVPAPGCNNDEDCGAGQVCDNGECVAEGECQSDADCDAGEVCDEATNTCVECDGNEDCDDNNACTADSCAVNTCAHAPIACTTVATCPNGCDNACTLLGVCSD